MTGKLVKSLDGPVVKNLSGVLALIKDEVAGAESSLHPLCSLR